MFHIRIPRFVSLFIAFSLLVGPLPLPALAQEVAISLSELEADIAQRSPDISYVYLGRDISDIIDVLSHIKELQ